MNKYFIEILKIKNSVIIPGLGSLMITNPKTGKIVLSPHLKFDDGTLVNFIAEKEGIDKAEAKNKVSKFVREIEAELDKGESYDIYQFGKITKNDKGDPTFDMDPSLLKEGVIIATKVENVKPVTEVKKEEVSEIKEAKPKNVYIPPVETKIEKTEKKIEKKVEDVKEDKESTTKEDKALKAKEEKTKLAEKHKQDKAKKEEKKKAAKLKLAQDKKDKAKSKKEAKPANKGEEKKKRRLAPLILLFITLGALAFGAYVFQDDIKASLGIGDSADSHEDVDHAENHDSDEHATIENVVSEDQLADTLNTEEVIEGAVIEEEAVVEEVAQQKPVNTNISGGYHIIGGGFSEESNATNYASKVGGTVLGRFDKLYLVAIKSYDSMSDAKADLSNVQSTSSSAWIFKYSK